MKTTKDAPRTSGGIQRLVLAGLALLFAAGCAFDAGEGDGGVEASASAATAPSRSIEAATFHGFDPTDAQARRGLDAIFAGKGFHAAIPTASLRAAARLGKVADLVPRRGERDGSDDADGRFADYGKLPSPPSRGVEAGTPLGTSLFERRGVELTNGNCFTCHAGAVSGQIVAGLGNHDLDQAATLADLERLLRIEPFLRADARLRVTTATRELSELDDFFENARETILPTYRYARARGDNMGPFAVWKRLSRLRDPATAGLEELPPGVRTERDDLFESVVLPPVDPNPWWTRKYRKTSYVWAESSGIVAAHFAFNFTTPHEGVNEDHERHVADIADILAFADATTSPVFPRPLDAAKVERGDHLFHGRAPLTRGDRLTCATCHGTYARSEGRGATGRTVDYPDRGVFDVGTDPAYSDLVTAFTPLATRGNEMKSFFAARGQANIAPQVVVPGKRGYAAPVLVGVWASAPYFHNGAVPTLYGVLASSARPTRWRRPAGDAFAYDLEEVGLAVEAVDPAPSHLASRAIYDTREYGRAPGGHTFGDAMTDDERYDVIEFLKSLGGEDLPPGR